MKILEAEFLEPVRNPHPQHVEGGRTIQRVKGEGALTIRALPGMGLVLEASGTDQATVVPWANVRFALVKDVDDAKGKRA